MSRVAAGITISVDGYFAGPNDGPGDCLNLEHVSLLQSPVATLTTYRVVR
jgi:hypothetical protein